MQDNTISYVGQEYFGSTGIFQGYAANSVFDHNVIHDIPYTGISVDGADDNASAYSYGNAITSNSIYNGMQVLQDGGGIYTLSAQNGTVITGNSIENLGTGLAGVHRFPFQQRCLPG